MPYVWSRQSELNMLQPSYRRGTRRVSYNCIQLKSNSSSHNVQINTHLQPSKEQPSQNTVSRSKSHFKRAGTTQRSHTNMRPTQPTKIQDHSLRILKLRPRDSLRCRSCEARRGREDKLGSQHSRRTDHFEGLRSGLLRLDGQGLTDRLNPVLDGHFGCDGVAFLPGPSGEEPDVGHSSAKETCVESGVGGEGQCDEAIDFLAGDCIAQYCIRICEDVFGECCCVEDCLA